MSDKESGQDRIEDTIGASEGGASKIKPEHRIAIIAAVIACVVGIAIGCGVALGVAGGGSQNAQTQPAPAQEQQQAAADDSGNKGDSGSDEASQDVHKHDWVAEYETVHHDAETHVVHHNATYENQTVYSTQCNVCGKYLDSTDNEGTKHCAEAGHKGFTKQVPHKETVEVKAAWDETVTDKAAYDESVLKDYKCSTCGVVASPEDVQKDSANQPTEA